MPCTPADLGIVLHNTDTAPLLCALSFVRVRHGKAAPLDGARPSQANAVAVSEYSHHLPCCKSTAWSHEKLEGSSAIMSSVVSTFSCKTAIQRGEQHQQLSRELVRLRDRRAGRSPHRSARRSEPCLCVNRHRSLGDLMSKAAIADVPAWSRGPRHGCLGGYLVLRQSLTSVSLTLVRTHPVGSPVARWALHLLGLLIYPWHPFAIKKLRTTLVISQSNGLRGTVTATEIEGSGHRV